jgi:hypothetical protein
MADLGYRPLVFFWVAEYMDGTALSQFDPETGKENLFKHVDLARVKRFGWYPFTEELAEKVFEAEGLIVVPSAFKSYVVCLEAGDRLVVKRENVLRYFAGSGEVAGRETVYVLGVEGKQILRIHEDGEVETV